MLEFEKLKQQFVNPPSEFSPMPFWFWNDKLTKVEIVRQIQDFHSKEVEGFIIHPRMGLPEEISYLSESYMELVETAVKEADILGMRIILYDEGMYPSGSASGLVVKRNPKYASRGLKLLEYPCTTSDGSVCFTFAMHPGEVLVSIQAVRKIAKHKVAAESILVLEQNEGRVEFTPPNNGEWSVLIFIDTLSEGTIRGVHQGQDDGEPNAPLAADLLNPDAVKSFISLTHEAYYRKLSRYFGSTIIAMFTDEPELLGRNPKEGVKPWTNNFMEEYITSGGRERELPALWFDVGEDTLPIRDKYESIIRNRLSRTYYKLLAEWCTAHGIGLTGHPAGSSDIGLLKEFHIPGQDVVWRSIAPEAGKSLEGIHSTMGKCSSDAARHRDRRRNLNECFGECGIEGGWSLTADNMKWYLDWLFIRGVNMICPHAFYYSIRGERRDERPPDVGPHNIWWDEFAQFSRYIKRMSWIMTDSINSAEVAIMAGPAYLPWKIVKPLFEEQIEFNYLEDDLLHGSVECNNGILEIAGYRYKAILIEDGRRLASSDWQVLEHFAKCGGLVIELSVESKGSMEIGQLRVEHEQKIPEILAGRLGKAFAIEPVAPSIRISKVTKKDTLFYVVVNEGETTYTGELCMKHSGVVEIWHPWTGKIESATVARSAEQLINTISLNRRECLVIAVDPSRDSDVITPSKRKSCEYVQDLSAGWHVIEGPESGELSGLTSWTDWPGMKHFSGTVVYERRFVLDECCNRGRVRINLGEVHEVVQLWVNGKDMGVRLWGPYTFDLLSELQSGTNMLRVSVTNSLANRYDGKSNLSGLIGPVGLIHELYE
jgi:hypothetical protein